MATVHGKIHLTLVDDVGVRAATQFYCTFDNTKTLAQVSTDVTAIGTLILPLVSGGWYRWSFETLAALPVGASTDPTPDADAEEVGNFSSSLTGTPDLLTFSLPTLADGVVHGSHINQSNSDVTAFQTGIVNAQANGTQVTDRRYTLPGVIVKTFLSTRKHRKSLLHKSLDIL